MRTVTATELARNLREILDRLSVDREDIAVERNGRQVARIVPGPGHQTAMEAMGDLFRTLPPEAGRDWLRDSRDLPGIGVLDDELRDPWAT